jgi:hypothetical protein
MAGKGSSGTAGAAAPAEPHADLVEEAMRITDAARDAAVRLRVTGGVAVALRCPSAVTSPLQRPYADLDMVSLGGERRQVTELLGGLGYQAHEQFNALHGQSQMLFYDMRNERHLDVFVDRMQMCHTVDLRDRLELHDRTLPLADLLLLKLQIVETNRKDFQDMLALLCDHELGEEGDGIDLGYLAGLCGRDWGLWCTTRGTAQRLLAFTAELEGFSERERVAAQVDRYVAALDAVPKSRGWSLRARIGERKRWYELPEEAH